MHLSRPFARCAVFASLWLLPLIASAQTLNINNDVQTYATLTNTAATLSGKSELRITGTGDPITGCTINLTSVDSWFFMTNIAPSTMASTFLSRVRVNGANAVLDSNVRVVQYGAGAVVIPHAPTFAPMTVYDGKSFTGNSRSLTQYTAYGAAELGSLNDAISSFKLKRGYTATIAQNPDGSGISRNFVAADGDLEVGALPATLNNSVSFVRVFPWRWVSKKGSCDVWPTDLNADWYYNWSISSNSTLDWEYVAIKQQPYWPGLNEDWKWRGVNHLSGYNEPNNSSQDAYKNLNPQGSVSDAVSRLPELLETGLRLGAPAVDDGGYSWIVNFVNQANAAGYRLDYVPIHYYRSYPNNDYPAGAAGNLYNFLKSIHDATGKPIWLTEFNNGANWTSDPDPTVDQNKNVIEAMINMMDSTWWIERYSIYSHVEWFRQTHYDDGSITPMGTMYRDHVAPIGYVQQVPSAGISAAAHYSFDGDLRDALVNGNDAMAVGAPVFVAGKYGQAISLDGATDYLQLAEPLGDSNDFTFTGWVNWNGGGNWQRIFDFGNGGTDNYVYLTPKSGTNTMRFGVRIGGVDQFVETTVLPTVGTWTHVAVTISDTTAKIFVNGTARATNTAFTFDPGALNTRFNYLGKSQWPDPLFSGKLDDLRFFTTALSDAQIAAIAGNAPPQFGTTLYTASATKLQQYTGSMAAGATGGSGPRTCSKAAGPAWLAVAANGALTGVPGVNDGGVNRFLIRVTDSIGALSTTTLDVTVAEAPGLVARYAFDGNANASVSTLNGTATGSPAYTTGVSGSAMDLDGTDDYVSLPAGLGSEDAITIASWFWRDSDAVWQRIFDFGTGTDEYMFLSARSNVGTIRFAIKDGGAEQALTTPMLPTGQWVHVAVTLGANVGKLYVNGVLKDAQTITIKPTDFLHEFNYIGKSQWPDPLLDGRIDEFLIFNKVLDAAQVAALANSTNRAPAFTADPFSKPAGTAGQIYEQTIAGSATDPNAGSTLTYSKVSGPAWLTVSANGRISGVPTEADAGTNRFIVRVTDATLLADDATLNIVVGNPTGLIAHHQFDGTVIDNIGGIAGITTTGSPVYITGIFDRALDFDGTDDVVQLRSTLLNGVTDLTIAARVRWDGGNDWQRVFDFGNSTSQYLFFAPKAGAISRFAIKNGGSEQVLDGPALTAGDWAHVAVTLIGNTGTLYLNGAAVATGSITIDPAAFTPTLNYLGDSQYAADPFFNGAIDDLRIYNRGLAAAEVSALAVPPAAVIVPDSSYGGWSAGIAFPAGQSAVTADPDGDGIANAWEYFLGSNPLLAGSGAFPPAQIRTAASLGLGATGKTYLTIQARVRKQHLSASFVAEAAATIADLALPAASAHAVQAGSPVADGDYEIFTFYFDTALEDSPTGTGFISLRAAFQ